MPIGNDWMIVRSYEEAVQAILDNGIPRFISFDHDLGADKTGYDFVKWLVEYDLDHQLIRSYDFGFYVHSQNPIGKLNIEGLLNSYLDTLPE